MSYSMNEVESTAKKAARGAGYSWGLAEDVAKGTRWLCAHRFQGCEALEALLSRNDGVTLSEKRPQVSGTTWRSSSNELCPILSGTAYSDFAAELKDMTISLESVYQPILFLPFASSAARQIGSPVTVTWHDFVLVTDGNRASIERHAARPHTKIADLLTVQVTGKIGNEIPRTSRAEPSAEAWQSLNQFAHRTYAPATEQSRLSGAGAGTTDND